jgi:hypothetical protein
MEGRLLTAKVTANGERPWAGANPGPLTAPA